MKLQSLEVDNATLAACRRRAAGVAPVVEEVATRVSVREKRKGKREGERALGRGRRRQRVQRPSIFRVTIGGPARG